ncbi:hypothetical protein G6F70_003144 [Rhizopus microsporus]|nr:hypothetical protein G6F70_003144 [Rhizopus microsporus]KAG1213895.1 hypothetical protein G6F69_002394 [Rhizopus microsporus]KAG1235684.1 hypothetical protein G6F67_002557 [Rhizopus microsporus]KAG1267779.1 hypothetical protein G6F68_001634 [Rhizopus microsporus]
MSLEEEHTLFLAYLGNGRTSAKSIQPKTVSRWLEGIMQDSGINTNKYKAHSLRSAASTKAVSLGVPIEQIKLHANWSLTSNTFEDYYYRPKDQHKRGSDIVNTVRIYFPERVYNGKNLNVETEEGIDSEDNVQVVLNDEVKKQSSIVAFATMMSEQITQFLIRITENMESVRKAAAAEGITERSAYRYKKQWNEFGTVIRLKRNKAGFNLYITRNRGWSIKSTPAKIEVPTARGTSITILGAISSQDIIDVSLREPTTVSGSKKRRTGGKVIETAARVGTRTEHFLFYLNNVMDMLDKNNLRGFYIVMDNASVHKPNKVRECIEKRGYKCVYLPPYSPFLNPIEEFWSKSLKNIALDG